MRRSIKIKRWVMEKQKQKIKETEGKQQKKVNGNLHINALYGTDCNKPDNP